MSLRVVYSCGCSSDHPPYAFQIGEVVKIRYTTSEFLGLIVGPPCEHFGYSVLLSKDSPDGQVLLPSVLDDNLMKIQDAEAPICERQFPMISSVVAAGAGIVRDRPYDTFGIGDIATFREAQAQRNFLCVVIGTECRDLGYSVLTSSDSPDGQVIWRGVSKDELTRVQTHEISEVHEIFPKICWDSEDPDDVDGSCAPASVAGKTLDS
jgi:hypothetical protein